jgi:hypothetical protein
MFKMIFLLAGLAVGFGAGVYWGHKNPEAAAKLSAEEERRFIEYQMKLTKATKEKLDRLINKHTGGGATPPGAAGFVSGSQTGGRGGVDPEIVSARDETDKQYAELQKKLQEIDRK